MSWKSAVHNPKFLLVCLCVAAVVQGMIFTNVVISTIEKRFGWDSTQSGIIAGSYDLGSLLSVIPVTYFGGKRGASKPRFIAGGLFMMGLGSLIFASPHLFSPRYLDNPVFQQHNNKSAISNEHPPVDLCLRNSSSEKYPIEESNCNENIKDGSTLHYYKYVFIFGQLFHGVGAAALITLGTTLLDESVPEDVAPVYISIFEASFVFGPAFGYVIGGRLLNIFTEFYADDPIVNSLTPSSPEWIGAWWLGFLLIFFLSFICASVISLFPAALEKAGNDEVKKAPPESSDMHIKLDYGKLEDLPNTLYGLLTNVPFMGITLGATMDGFLLAGQAAFLPKYLESQFALTASNAAFLVGAVVVPAGALGTLLGGLTLNKLKLDRQGAIKLYLACQFIILPLYFGFLFNCPTAPILGVNVPYTNETCNFGCDCGFKTDFVCSEIDNLSYLSGCHAGCSVQMDEISFGQCSCTNSIDAVITKGLCDQNCNHIYLAVLLFFQVLFTFMGTMPGLVAGLRSVIPEQKSIALGFQTLIARSLGTVPGPIFFGFIIDQTCLLWHMDLMDQDKCWSQGNCQLYDNTSMSHYVLIILLIWRLLATSCFLLAFIFCKKPSTQHSVAT